jgi:archaellin
MTISGVNSDGDSLLETGEKFKVEIDFTELPKSGLDPEAADWTEKYAHPYEEFRVELRPSAGAVLTIERQIPAVYSAVMTIE